MLKIKHKQLDEERLIRIRDWNDPLLYNHNLWDILEKMDIVDVYEVKTNTFLGEYEKDHALQMLRMHPNDYRFEESRTGNRFPMKTPKKKTIAVIADKINPVVSKAFNNDYIKYTIIGLIVSIATYFCYEYLKYKRL